MVQRIKRLRLRRYKTVLTFLPMILAFSGYMIYYRANLLNSLYSSLRIYLVATDYGDLGLWPDPSQRVVMQVLFECARWLGLCVTATFITQMFRETFVKLRVRWRAERRNAIALHGSSKYLDLMKENFGCDTIADEVPEKFRASRHILAFDNDMELFRYLGSHFTQFLNGDCKGLNEAGKASTPFDKSIFLCMVASPRTEYLGHGFVINNMAENCARLYWDKLFARRFSGPPEKRVVLIGFGCFGRALFKQALMVNVFLESADMDYHIFGDSEDFEMLYSGIDRFASVNKSDEGMDSVYFHKDRWEQNIPVLTQADRVVLADDSDEINIQTLSALMDLGVTRRIHVRASNARLIKELWPHIRVREYEQDAAVCVFGTEDSLYNKKIVMDEQLLQKAKKIHARYLRRVGKGKCLNCPEARDVQNCVTACEAFDNDWSGIGRFLQEANITQADHMPVKLRQFLKRDCEISPSSLQEFQEKYGAIKHNRTEMEPFSALEHARWMRHHFFYGWEYAPVRDDSAKKHPLLLPYDKLPENQKTKDLDAYDAIIDLMK